MTLRNYTEGIKYDKQQKTPGPTQTDFCMLCDADDMHERKRSNAVIRDLEERAVLMNNKIIKGFGVVLRMQNRINPATRLH